ncbi:MAG: hypothetical protein IIB59_06985, partial [Planctomycetes bacterium]|nr:hypothetical protein [Planctomycetota bacterium]
VLLNEPGHYDSCQEEFVPERFSDARDRVIATRVAALARTLGEFQLSEVLAGFEDPAIQSRAVQLAERGGARGNYEKTLLVARRKVQDAGDAGLDAEIIEPPGEQSSAGDGGTDPVSVRFDAIRRRKPHFAPPRMRGSNLRPS